MKKKIIGIFVFVIFVITNISFSTFIAEPENLQINELTDCVYENEIVKNMLNIDPCVVPDNGIGTADLPALCPYEAPDDPFYIIDGLSPGTTIELDPLLTDFENIVRLPGGLLGGEVLDFDATLELAVSGTGDLTGFNRNLAVPVSLIVHTGPRVSGNPVQSFPSDLFELTGELFGDPDFCTFRIRAGTNYGLPSPGQFILTELPTGDYNIDSFFDITYQIEFEGCPGSIIEAMAGTTTATTRIQQGIPMSNNPPNTPSQLSGPSSGDSGVPLTYTSSTTDPDDDDVKYHLDVNNDGVIDHTSTYFYSSGSTYTIQITISGAGTYYLRLKAEDVHGAQSGWSTAKTVTISGGGNDPPNTPSAPSGQTSCLPGISYTYTTSTTDNDGDQIKYGFDWDGNNIVDEWSGLLDSGDICSLSHSWGSSGSYQVKVKAKDEHDAESSWSTTLTVIISAENDPPTKPNKPSGPNSGKTGTSYTYSTEANDPNGDQIYYKWDWGDETSEWTGPYNSGDTVTASHVWTIQGTYAVKVQAKDINDEESVWSDPLEITMPKSKNIKYDPFGLIFVFGLDVDIKLVQLEPGEDYVDLEVLSKPFYIFENGMKTINPGAFLRLYSAKGLFLTTLPFCIGTCTDWGIIGLNN